jgi:hypothetical protein
MWAYQTFNNIPCPHINAELLLVSRMDYVMRILRCLLVLLVNIDDAAGVGSYYPTRKI